MFILIAFIWLSFIELGQFVVNIRIYAHQFPVKMNGWRRGQVGKASVTKVRVTITRRFESPDVA
jgi:hypothetical protein